jgi:alginate O-acetyltransferase complex protein AlgI
MNILSIQYIVFIIVFFVLYYTAQKSVWVQNLLILIGNLVFYSLWDYRFCLLILTSGIINYYAGLYLASEKGSRHSKLVITLLVIHDFGLLGVFKYLNFFILSFSQSMAAIGIHLQWETLNLIIPLGISFFTFQNLSYGLDIRNKVYQPKTNLFSYLAFSSFFPLIVSGPIERAKHLLPQLNKPRLLLSSNVEEGLKQIGAGLFKKLVIADNLAPFVNQVFGNVSNSSGTDLVCAAFLFSIQLYTDFSGYSDIAVGISKLLGLHVKNNFSYPFFSRNIGEFWRRWHISLSSFLRDYLYTPLTYTLTMDKKHSQFKYIILTFTLCGLWHGANWTFIAWGLLNGIYFFPQVFFGVQSPSKRIVAEQTMFPTFSEFLQVLSTFILVVLTFVVFRTASLADTFTYFSKMCTSSYRFTSEGYASSIISILYLLYEWTQRREVHILALDRYPALVRWGLYCSAGFLILVFGNFGGKTFLYSKF